MLKNRKSILDISIYFIFTLLLFFMVFLKSNYHIDEFFSYNLANHNGISSFIVEDGKEYNSLNDIFLEYTSINNENRFSISNVWNNQKNDVHPPLYYLIFNIICSFFPNTFSKWYPGIINIIAAILTFYFARKILKQLTDNNFIYYIVSIIYIFTTGLLDDVAFFRMYYLAMLWATINTYLFIKLIDKFDKKIVVEIAVITVLGAITHYYCIIYFVLLSTIYGIYLLTTKQYKNTIFFVILMLVSGLCSYIIFPSMIDHMFSGYRGTEALGNFFDLDNYIGRLVSYFNNIGNELFGNQFKWILIILIALFIVNIIKKNSFNNKYVARYLIVVLPSIIYFLFVSKIAAYVNERYVSIVYPMIVIGLITLIFVLLNKLMNSKYFKLLASMFAILLLGSGFYYAEWTYLYRDTQELITQSENYKDCTCICLHGDIEYDILHNSIELKNYKTFISFDIENIGNLDKYTKNNELIVKVLKVDNHNNYSAELLKLMPNYNYCEVLGSARNGTTYHLY